MSSELQNCHWNIIDVGPNLASETDVRNGGMFIVSDTQTMSAIVIVCHNGRD